MEIEILLKDGTATLYKEVISLNPSGVSVAFYHGKPKRLKEIPVSEIDTLTITKPGD